VVIPSELDTQPHLFINIKMEDSYDQQWSWTLAVGAVFALCGVCSIYNWSAAILGNIRLRPQPQSPPAADATPPTHPSKLTLPTFWISEPAAWFALAESKFRTSNITSQRVMFDLLVAALPEKHLSQVMDIIKAIPAINPYEVLKLRLLESDQEKMDALFQLGPLGDRKPSQLLASMLSVCPSELELQPIFQYLFMQRLPQMLRTLLSEQECGDIRALAALADRLWASHKPQPYEVMAVQTCCKRIREISSPDSSVFCFACLCEYPNKSSHILRWFCCLLQYPAVPPTRASLRHLHVRINPFRVFSEYV
jgi:hypothetical protein